MQINTNLFVKGALSLAACSIVTGCVDDKYDLTDIDTSSRVTVDNLTVPLNLSEIKLDKVIKLDDNENISKIIVGDREVYAIQKGGEINTSDFKISGIHVNAPQISSSEASIENIPSTPAVPGVDLGLNFALDLPLFPMQSYNFAMQNIDKSLLSLANVKTVDPIEVKVELSIIGAEGLINDKNKVSFKNLSIVLPWGLADLTTDIEGSEYNQATGELKVPELSVNTNGKAIFTVKASGIELGEKGNINENDHSLNIDGNVGISSGKIDFLINTVSLPSSLKINVDYYVNSFDIKSFSGNIDYKMDHIDIAPISLSDLPDFLDSPETEIRIANPSILVNINNPVGQYNLTGSGYIRLTSDFGNNVKEDFDSEIFNISKEGAHPSFGAETDGYNHVGFNGLGNILTSTQPGLGLPERIIVNLEDIEFKGFATDFPIGTIENAEGDYNFTAPLGFSQGSMVVYETTEDGWGGDDLDDLYINRINLTAKCTTNLPVGIYLKLSPLDKNGNVIPVTEQSGFMVSANCKDEEVTLAIEGANGPIHGFDGIRFRAQVTQDSGDESALGPDMFINLEDIRITVDGYYDTDF